MPLQGCTLARNRAEPGSRNIFANLFVSLTHFQNSPCSKNRSPKRKIFANTPSPLPGWAWRCLPVRPTPGSFLAYRIRSSPHHRPSPAPQPSSHTEETPWQADAIEADSVRIPTPRRRPRATSLLGNLGPGNSHTATTAVHRTPPDWQRLSLVAFSQFTCRHGGRVSSGARREGRLSPGG